MITAVDSSVLIDVLFGDVTFGLRSAAALHDAANAGSLVACDVVWAEVAGSTRSWHGYLHALHDLGVNYLPVSSEAAVAAGATWAQYRATGGPRDRMVPDFLVGAHALTQADRLLTRDRGFYRRYFETLTILDPTKA